ncbi:hypothetical protein BHE74_00031563 [Ensete ventricosum]|nr:hypothetical protein BHE74_00031563 [Ensete ventricosum]
MKRHDPTLVSTRVYVIGLYPRKVSCLYSMFYLLRQLPSYGLYTLLSSTQVALLRDLHCVNGSPHIHYSTGQPSVEFDFHIDSKCAFI